MQSTEEKQKGTAVIAVDLGASSGRVICVTYDGKHLELEEIYRFPNEGIHVGERFYTDILHLYHEIILGLQEVWKQGKRPLSVGIDSWGVDFAVLDKEGELLGNPCHYRDGQAAGMIGKAEKIFGKQGLFFLTGIQDMWFNTVYQFLGLHARKPDFFEKAEKFLMLPDVLGYFLTGRKCSEYTAVSTTQMYDVGRKQWSDTISYELGLRKNQFPEVVMTGSLKGKLRQEVKKWIGVPKEEDPELVAIAEHDSASAAFAVPAGEEHYIFINSGTWSIIGMVLDEPVITTKVYEKGYSNEGAAFGKIKLVKSIMGMWLIQELRKSWEKRRMQADYGFLISKAQSAELFSCLIDADDDLFAAPVDMEEAINVYCECTGQKQPDGQGAYYRAVMESLALKYREAVSDLEQIVGENVDTLYLLGGAVQDQMFCQFIANATGKKVSAGPVEATAVGNALVQFKALGILKNEKEYAKLIKKSFDVCYYEPEDVDLWDQMYAKYKEIINLRS